VQLNCKTADHYWPEARLYFKGIYQSLKSKGSLVCPTHAAGWWNLQGTPRCWGKWFNMCLHSELLQLSVLEMLFL